MVDAENKLAYFQAITGIEDTDLCIEILQAHGWDLELAVSSITSGSTTSSAHASDQPRGSVSETSPSNSRAIVVAGPALAWKLVTLPIHLISNSLGLISGAVGFGLWAAGGILSYSLGIIGLNSSTNQHGESSARLISAHSFSTEATEFVSAFEHDYGLQRPNFVAEGFMDALQRSRDSFKLLFVYLHSPDHPDTPIFCEKTLCSHILSMFINENFVAWGGSIKSSEGFKMSNSLKASRFPFCAIVMPATNQKIALLRQVEGPKYPEEMLGILQRVLEESAPVLIAARIEAEERRNNARLREEQDAAYRAALEADQARERQRKEEQERIEREAIEEARKQREEKEACERAALEATEKEAAFVKLQQEKALSLGNEPESGPNVTKVLIRFPSGDRKERRFHNTMTIQSLYDFVDSLGYLGAETYCLVSNFPRVVYGSEKLSLSLLEAGLHPQASLFIEIM